MSHAKFACMAVSFPNNPILSPLAAQKYRMLRSDQAVAGSHVVQKKDQSLEVCQPRAKPPPLTF